MMYRIKNLETGLFSKGGQTPRWSKIGKVWPSSGALTSHLVQMSDERLMKQPWEIQEFDFESGRIIKTWNVIDYLNSRPSRISKQLEDENKKKALASVDREKLRQWGRQVAAKYRITHPMSRDDADYELYKLVVQAAKILEQ